MRKGKVYNFHRAREIRESFKKFLLEFGSEFYELDCINDCAFIISDQKYLVSFDSTKIFLSKRIDKTEPKREYIIVDERFSLLKLKNLLKKNPKN